MLWKWLVVGLFFLWLWRSLRRLLVPPRKRASRRSAGNGFFDGGRRDPGAPGDAGAGKTSGREREPLTRQEISDADYEEIP